MGTINWFELFPTKLSIFIFISYIGLFVNQGILVTASQNASNNYSYNTVTVVLLTEVLKLIVSTVLYCRDHTFKSLWQNVIKYSKVLGLYFVPAILYCLYNNLAFTNLSTFDPTTYYLLLQFRVVITGILFQVIFKNKLSRKQWLSLIILTVGCMLKQVDFGSTKDLSISKNTKGLDFSLSAVLILVQTVCSCLAGVYNEYLLKDSGAEVNIFVQNVFMYIDSIVCNCGILLIQGNLHEAFTLTSLKSVFHYKVVFIMFNNAAVGIITSFFLRSLNSIIKTFASALELVFTAILCYLFFNIPIYLNTVLSIAIVSYAVILYSQNPVVNTGKIKEQRVDDKERQKMLDDVEEV